jgi:hypothetical protein
VGLETIEMINRVCICFFSSTSKPMLPSVPNLTPRTEGLSSLSHQYELILALQPLTLDGKCVGFKELPLR